ncbi:MAG: hypothetical protein ACNA8R_15265 [Nitriliruptoraceae bacterium]
MRRSLQLLLPTRPEQRRTRLLTTLTLVAGAATIAAVSATSTSSTSSTSGSGPGGDPMTAAAAASTSAAGAASTSAAGAATRDRTAGAGGAGTEVEDGSTVEALDALTPLDGELTHGELDPVGPIERIAQVEPLPTLRTQAERIEALVYVAADGTEVTPERIFAFLDGRGAPLAAQAELLVEAGIRHDVDPRVVVAIAIAESNGGEMHPQGTHNVWGWSGSGGPRGLRAWDSWEASIDEYTARLGALYDTDNVDWAFASTYCPPNTQWWYDTVTWAIAQI